MLASVVAVRHDDQRDDREGDRCEHDRDSDDEERHLMWTGRDTPVPSPFGAHPLWPTSWRRGNCLGPCCEIEGRTNRRPGSAGLEQDRLVPATGASPLGPLVFRGRRIFSSMELKMDVRVPLQPLFGLAGQVSHFIPRHHDQGDDGDADCDQHQRDRDEEECHGGNRPFGVNSGPVAVPRTVVSQTIGMSHGG